MHPKNVPQWLAAGEMGERGLCPSTRLGDCHNHQKHIHELPIQKGQSIFLALGAYQRLESLWGSNTDEFKPSRWLEGDPCPGHALGPYAQLVAFLGGPRVCAGWCFAILEKQVIFTEVLGKYLFSLPEDNVVRSRIAATHFPVDGEGVKGLWLSVTLCC
ncbi:cytochrome P450 [Mycena rosella]|uniref:Cytochrome P450 n=1 Tax=Mycena rosella TaxID=1033263 RepID=A0AAD7G8A7_MYCRO|nr:cytochrome P450 [Mycena rosella]